MKLWTKVHSHYVVMRGKNIYRGRK